MAKTVKKISLSVLPSLYWLFLSHSREVLFWRTPSIEIRDVDYLSGNPLERSIFFSLLVLGIIIVINRREKVLKLLTTNRILLILYFFMGVSCLWSAFPALALKRYIKSVGTMIMAAVILTEEDPFVALEHSLGVFLRVVLSLSLLFIYFHPDVGVENWIEGTKAWRGITYGKNTLGQISAFGFLYFLWKFRYSSSYRERGNSFLFILLSAYLVIGSKSMTSISMVLIGFPLFVFIVQGRTSINRCVALAIIFLLPLCAGIILLLSDIIQGQQNFFSALLSVFNRDLTFTGRTFLWADVLRYVAAKPWLGYGYGSFWVGDLVHNIWTTQVWQPNQAHNGYIDVLVNLGIVGLFLVVLFIASAYRGALVLYARNQKFGVLYLTMLTTILFSNIFESSLVRMTHMYWFLFLLFSTNPLQEYKALVGTRLLHSKQS